jgi:hypothetical protein
MATVKTTVDESGQRRVITKLNEDGERRVSCSCCSDATCCVFPASCGIAPAQIEFYGETLTGNGTTFGDTTNGVILESGAWAVYRNGIRSERDCLGLALPGFTTNVAAVLATSYTLSFDYVNYNTGEGNPPDAPVPYELTLVYGGTSFLEAQDRSVCSWIAESPQGTPLFEDVGAWLIFDPQSCKWQISVALDLIVSEKDSDQSTPTGAYPNFGPETENLNILGLALENIVIS